MPYHRKKPLKMKRSKNYASTHRGQNRFPIGGRQDKYMHVHKIRHTHVHTKRGKKRYKRYYA